MSYTPEAQNAKVEIYLNELPETMRDLFLDVRTCIHAAYPNLNEDIKWRNCLTYSVKKNLIQTVLGKDKISLIFFAGQELDDPSGLLSGDGNKTKTARIIATDYSKEALSALVRQAAVLAA